MTKKTRRRIQAGLKTKIIAASALRSPCCGVSSTVTRSPLKKTAHAEEQQRADVQNRRGGWFAGQLDVDPTKLVFIDETGASTNLARKSGRCRRGRRLRAAISHSHYKTVTLIAGLRLRGLTAGRTFDGPINAALFEDWVETCLVPTLSPGETVSWTISPLTRGRGSSN